MALDHRFQVAAAHFPSNYPRVRGPDRLFVQSTREHLASMPLPEFVALHPALITIHYPSLVLERSCNGGAYCARIVDPLTCTLSPPRQTFVMPTQADALRRFLVKSS